MAYRSAGPAPLPKTRLGRAAKFAFGAAVAGTMTITGCGDDGTASDVGTDTSTTLDTGTGDTGAAMDSAIDTGNVAPPYGIPADTGPDGDLPDGGDDGSPGDASPPMDSGSAAAYGAPPGDASP